MSLVSQFFEGLRNVIHDIHALSLSLHQGQRNMLQQITEVQASLAALAQQAADNSIKIDALISLAQSSVNSGTPVTQEDLDALTQIKQQADAINQQIGTADAKADVALAPPPPAIALSPAPAATPTAPDRSTSVDPDPAS